MRVLAAIAVALATVAVTPAQAGAAVKPEAPASTFYGMHDLAAGDAATPWSTTSVSAVRLWDTGTSWREIEPQEGVYDWTRLDAAVRKAATNRAAVHYVLGQTPLWAAADPNASTAYGAGAGSYPTSEAAWVAYVSAVATRYKGWITSYETWNEANIRTYSWMTPQQVARLQSLAYRTIKAIDPSAVVTAPSVTLRGPTGNNFLAAFAAAGGFRYADVINLHGYPEPDGTPERAQHLVHRATRKLARLGVHLPVWNTEMNFALPWGGTGISEPLTVKEQRAWLARALLLSWSDRVQRLYWYMWSSAPFLGVSLTEAGSRDPSPVMTAWTRVRTWLRHPMTRCVRDEAGTYYCRLSYRGRDGWVAWNPDHTVRTPVNHRVKYRITLTGKRVPVRHHRTRIGPAPALIR